MQTPEVEILYEEGSLAMAEKVAKLYPLIRLELEKDFSWEADFTPRIILIRDRSIFVRAAGSELYLAYAVPKRYQIVLDASRVYANPFTVEATLKHELCHLLLHHHIPESSLPRWLDEGVCQWISKGISELLVAKGSTALAKAIITDRMMKINDMEKFPNDEKSIVLAYEQSKNLIEYIEMRYGRETILRILKHARDGHTADESLTASLSVGLPELENEWHAHLRGKFTWIVYLSSNFYTILFILGGIITIFGFILFQKKRRAYVDEEESNGL